MSNCGFPLLQTSAKLYDGECVKLLNVIIRTYQPFYSFTTLSFTDGMAEVHHKFYIHRQLCTYNICKRSREQQSIPTSMECCRLLKGIFSVRYTHPWSSLLCPPNLLASLSSTILYLMELFVLRRTMCCLRRKIEKMKEQSIVNSFSNMAFNMFVLQTKLTVLPLILQNVYTVNKF